MRDRKGVILMTFHELMNIREQTTSARTRLEELRDAGILTPYDVMEAEVRFSQTWYVVHDFMVDHEIGPCRRKLELGIA